MKGKQIALLGSACGTIAVGVVVWTTISDDTRLESRFNYKRAAPLTFASHSVSHDGSTIVTDRFGAERGHIVQLRRDEHKPDRLTPVGSSDRQPVFSVTGRKIAFTRETGGYEHVWIMNADGSNPVQVTHGRVLDYAVRFSSNEDKVYFIRYDWYGRALKPRHAIFSVSLSGKETGRVEKIGDGESIAPGGDKVIFEKDAVEGNKGIWVRNRADGREWIVGNGSSATFSADGKRIAYLFQTEDYRDEVVIVNADGTGRTKIPASPGAKRSLAFCSGDSAITFLRESSERDGPGKIVIVPLSDYREHGISID